MKKRKNTRETSDGKVLPILSVPTIQNKNTTSTKSSFYCNIFEITWDMMDYEQAGSEQIAQHMELSAASTTIDASVVQSRIRQSASIQKENAAMMEGDQPVFPKLSAAQASGNKIEYRRVRCPPHRYTPLREHWEQILTPLVEYLKLQVRKMLYQCQVETKSICIGGKDPQSECPSCCSWN